MQYKPHQIIKLVRLEKPVLGRFYVITKDGEVVKDGLSLDAANEVLDSLTEEECIHCKEVGYLVYNSSVLDSTCENCGTWQVEGKPDYFIN